MSRELRSEADRFEVHAVLLVIGLLLAAALTKGGHPMWGIASALTLYGVGVMTKLLAPIIARRPSGGIAEGHSAI